MVQGYYTLEEAARILGMNTDTLSQMAQKREIRAFADRGTWRFRTQDIEELARRKGRGSAPDLPLGEAPRTPQAKPSTPKPATSGADPGVFHFDLGASTDQVELGQELQISASGSRSGSGSGKSPSPQPGSDSDVKLVPDESDVDFKIHVEDSNVKVERTPPRSSPSRKKGDSSKPGSSKKTSTPPVVDSGVRLVPMEGEGTAPPKSLSDSDVRINVPISSGGPGSEALLTEEIDLDAELRKAEEAARARKGQTPPKKPVTKKADSSTSLDLEVPTVKKQPTPKPVPRSQDDDAVVLGDLGVVDLAESSGINLSAPDDSGINLEKPGHAQDPVEFELHPEHPASTPKPAQPAPADDSSSEFELSLDVEATPKPAPAVPEADSSSEFELSLDVEATPKPVAAKPEDDSSSEFELTLDDSGQLAPMEGSSGEHVVETDFEVPALEEDSSEMEAVDDDTALESSDFDLSLNEEESSSQVVALDDEADEEAETVRRPALDEEEPAEVDELLDEDLVTTAAEEGEETEAVAAAPAPWGVVPVLALLPCVLVMFLVTLMSFELLHNLWGYHQPTGPASVVTQPIAQKLFQMDVAGAKK